MSDMSDAQFEKSKVGDTMHVGFANFIAPMIDTEVFIKRPGGEKVAARVVGVEGTAVELKITKVDTRYPLD